jgi:short-subunit dehydrogenase
MTLSVQESRRLRERYGPVALVTGASSGIGLALAEALASAGFDLLLCARRRQALDSAAERFRDAHQVRVSIHAADLSGQDGLSSLLDATRDLNLGLFIHASGFGTSGLFTHADLRTEQDMLRVNCEALLVLTHHFSRLFAARKRGGIIMLSSIVAFQGVPNAAHYAATKAYVQSFAEGLARELKPAGVDVLAAAPGPVESGFGQRAGMHMPGAMKPGEIAVPILQALGRRSTVLPGRLTRILSFGLQTVPRWGKIRIMEKVMYGMTREGK